MSGETVLKILYKEETGNREKRNNTLNEVKPVENKYEHSQFPR